MKNRKGAAVAVLMFVPVWVLAQDDSQTNVGETAEIVVVGRSLATSSSLIEIEREFLVDTAAALRDIPGANVNRNGLITGIAQYRGMYGDRVAVDIDQMGVISGGPNAMDTPLSYMSPMMTEELAVSRGIASVSLAPEAIGGHVSAKTSRGEFGGDTVRASGVLGTRFSSNGDLSTSVARLTLANHRHRISAIAEADNGNDINTAEGEIRPSGLRRDRYDFSYSFADGDRSLMVFAGKLDTTDTGTPALPMDIIFIDTELFGAQFVVDVASHLLIEGRFSFNDVDHEMDNYSLRQAPMAPMYRVNNTTGSGSQFYLAGTRGQDASQLLFGIDGISAKHESVITNPNNAMFQVNNFVGTERDLLGVFAEWTQELDNGQVEIGVRYKQVEADTGNVSTTGMMGMMAENVDLLAADFNAADRNLSWSSFDGVIKYRRIFAETAEWNIEIGSKTRAPSYQELFLWLPLQATGGLADGRSYVGNLDLREERSTELVIGSGIEIGRFAMSPQVYFRKVDDYIQGTPSTNMAANMVSRMMTGKDSLQFANVDAEIWGFDAAWNYELTERLFLDGVVTIARGRRTDIDDDLYRLSPFNASIGLTYNSDTWSFKSEVIGFAEQQYVSSTNDETETPGYWLVNLGFTWNPLASLRVEARVENLLDERYQDHVTGINRADGSDIAVGTRLFGAERTISAGLIYSF
jgi:iron complex outermembrane receptor protein